MYLRDAGRFRIKVFALLNNGAKQIDIARTLGVSRQRINQIVHYEKHLARAIVTNRVTCGTILKASLLKCVACGEQAEEYDHRDYKKSKEVEPLCKRCHTKRTPHWHTGIFDSKRRPQIMKLKAKGLSNKKIADELGISVQRVHKIVSGK